MVIGMNKEEVGKRLFDARVHLSNVLTRSNIKDENKDKLNAAWSLIAEVSDEETEEIS